MSLSLNNLTFFKIVYLICKTHINKPNQENIAAGNLCGTFLNTKL